MSAEREAKPRHPILLITRAISHLEASYRINGGPDLPTVEAMEMLSRARETVKLVFLVFDVVREEVENA